MGRKCLTCEHERRAEIELLLARHMPLSVIAKRFDIAEPALCRHRSNHMPDDMRARLAVADQIEDVDLEALRRRESEGLLQSLVVQRARLYRLGDDARDAGDIRAAAQVENAITRAIELTAKLVGEIAQANRHVSINFLGTDSYHLVRTALMQALRPYPDAARAVASALQDVERKTAPAPAMIEGRAA